MLIEWRDTLLVGYQPMDQEHRALVTLINELYDDIRTGCRRETIDEALFSLADHVAAHFNHENALMVDHDYPDRAEHLLAHRKLIEQLDTVLDGIDLLDNDALLRALDFADRWFTGHVVDDDARLGAFLAHAGVLPPHPDQRPEAFGNR